MSETPYNLESPYDIDLASHEEHVDFFDEQWEQHMAGLGNEHVDENLEQPTHQHHELPAAENAIASGPSNAEQQSSGENAVSYAVVRVWINDGIRQNGPSQRAEDYIHVSGPGMYADNPLPNPAEDAPVETLLPTTDEDEIRRWKLVPCSACVQYENYYACFTGKWQEQPDRPIEFSCTDRKGPGVIESKMECIADDDNGNPLLLVTMMVLRRGVVSKIELWGKRMVGGETTQLSADEREYCWWHEQKRIE